ncbi:hypothetical protein [Luteolibacter soli]|uniref:WYL domain-containing protein n=1 Tax=Luteolibacter soli TaxID=3135280 RepID=A0ABU9AYD8_9BACT
MALQKNALMADLRGAIRHYRVIRFAYEGRKYEVEPHELGRNPVTGTYELKAWVRRTASEHPRWLTFNYWNMRALEVLPDTFLPRLVKESDTSMAG